MDLNSKVPDQNTIWTFKQNLLAAGADLSIFNEFVRELERLGIVTRKGAIIDAAFAEAPRQRNTRNENKKLGRRTLTLFCISMKKAAKTSLLPSNRKKATERNPRPVPEWNMLTGK